jgi:hypothetical protein
MAASAEAFDEPLAHSTKGDAMSANADFTKMLPGFDFLQGLMKNAGAGVPGLSGLSQWIAPTLDPEELDKRIGELRTVQFWLEQNARMLGATLQALEVQRLTLTTLKTMNMPLAEISESMRIKLPEPAPEPAPEPVAAAAAAGAVDPMAWWGALTQQFTELAAKAMKDARADGGSAAATPQPAASAPARPRAAAKPVARKGSARKVPRAAAGG